MVADESAPTGVVGNAGCRGGPCSRPFLVCHVMIAPEGAPTEVVEDARCRSGFSRDIFMGADKSPLTEGPLLLAGARGIWRDADLSAIDMGWRYRENRG